MQEYDHGGSGLRQETDTTNQDNWGLTDTRENPGTDSGFKYLISVCYLNLAPNDFFEICLISN